MPIMRITMPQGATPEQKVALFDGLTEAAHTAFAADYEKIRIMLVEVPAGNISIGGVSALAIDDGRSK
ncbi:MAG: 4-oxalocrotonate tautomerase [Alphaproteobacteria bacterium HGW-Alphaproteobacteria-5]|jgi:4-oxalocrotonate tautomerase|nr:MAG: 4-oxalocrotonate tautomerase [Alphaproteobacteria bacterium HGW-Alphaproteobacteria-5]